MSRLTYLDNNASTQPLDEVVAAMHAILRDGYANPSSLHQFGQSVRHEIERARVRTAALIDSKPEEIVFTASGTESINLAIRGVLATHPHKKHVVTSAVEHSAVHRLGQQLVREGYTVDEIGVDSEGRIDPDELASCLTDDTAVVSLLWANNETGVLIDAEAIAQITSERNVPLHLDAVQAVGKIPVSVQRVPVQLLSISAHKFHGPKGAGALYVRRRTRLRPLIVGGGQERNLRGGTENVPAIVGLGVAAEAAVESLATDSARVAALRDRLEREICDAIPIARIHGGKANRIGNTTNIGFRALQSEAILLLLSERGICASGGSACSSGSLEPSHVLQAMNIPTDHAHGAIRFSLSRFTTEEDIQSVVTAMPEIVARLSPRGGV